MVEQKVEYCIVYILYYVHSVLCTFCIEYILQLLYNVLYIVLGRNFKEI